MISFPAGRRIWAAFLANGFVRGARIAEQLVVIPLLLSVWGNDRFGEWTALTSLASLTYLFNLGIGNAAYSDIVLRHGAGDTAGAARSFVTSTLLITALAGAGFVTAFVLLQWQDVGTVMALHSVAPGVAKGVVLLYSFATLISFYEDPLTGVLGAELGLRVPYVMSAISKIGEIICIAAAVHFDAGPLLVTAITTAAITARILTMGAAAARWAPWLSFSVRSFDITVLAHTWKASLGYFFTYVCITFAYVQVPRLLIFHGFGAGTLAVFTVVMAYTRAARMVGAMISQSARLEIGRVFAGQDVAAFGTLVQAVIGSTVGVTFILLVGEMALAQFIIPLWTSGHVQVDWLALGTLALVALAGSLFDASFACVTAINRVSAVAIGYGLSLAVGLATGAIAMQWLGPVAMYLSLLIPELGGTVGAALTLRRILPRTSVRAMVASVRLAGLLPRKP
jgi:O-antigen/teichoic acid export membrane protein